MSEPCKTITVKMMWADRPQAEPKEVLIAVGWDDDTDGLPSNDDEVFFYAPKDMNEAQVLHAYSQSSSLEDWYIVLGDPDYVLEDEWEEISRKLRAKGYLCHLWTPDDLAGIPLAGIPDITDANDQMLDQSMGILRSMREGA